MNLEIKKFKRKEIGKVKLGYFRFKIFKIKGT